MKVNIRSLQQEELAQADQIFRLAFGTFVGLPDPLQFYGDATYVNHRWQNSPTTALAAEIDGRLVGSNFVVRWGSFGYFGPLSVHPDYWNQGVGQHLIEPAIDCFSQWNCSLGGLFTFATSAKHHGLYQKFGFKLRFLTAIMSKGITNSQPLPSDSQYSQLNLAQQNQALIASQELTDAIYPGLDLSAEIQGVQAQSLGDTLLLWDDGGLVGLAICHYGANTEAGSNTCYIKFAAVPPGNHAAEKFVQLLDICAALSANVGMSQLIAGVNTSRENAYEILLAHGFRVDIIGVAMHRPNEPGFSHSDMFVLDDWR